MPRTDILLFDLDGTLTDNYDGIARSICFALRRLDAEEPDVATLRRCVGPPLRESFAWLLNTDDPTLIEDAIACYRERFAEIGWRENIAYAGIAEALDLLAAEYPRMYVCTAKPEIYARRIATLFGLDQRFAGVYGADLAGAFDDKATLLAHIATREGFDSADAIMIGDREHDLRAARINGARSIGVLWGYGSREELGAADALAATPAELPDRVRSLQRG